MNTWCEACEYMGRSVWIHGAKHMNTWCEAYEHMARSIWTHGAKHMNAWCEAAVRNEFSDLFVRGNRFWMNFVTWLRFDWYGISKLPFQLLGPFISTLNNCTREKASWSSLWSTSARSYLVLAESFHVHSVCLIKLGFTYFWLQLYVYMAQAVPANGHFPK